MRSLLLTLFSIITIHLHAQHLGNVTFHENARVVNQFADEQGRVYSASYTFPIVSYEVNDVLTSSADTSGNIAIIYETNKAEYHPGVHFRIKFSNRSKIDTLRLSNIVPFGTRDNHVYITGKGKHSLSRTHLFLPGKGPVNVIVPDNAWELGYCSFDLDQNMSVAALTRRDLTSLKNATRRRFETILLPGGSVTYNFYADLFQGNWQSGLTEFFQKHMLYDVTTFDSTMYQRPDLQWIKHAYVMHLIMAWDKDFYDSEKNTLLTFARRGKNLYGGDDVIGIWPTWPTLGLDQRNQFDMFRDLPGGTAALQSLSDSLHLLGTRFFVCYNPWDESTRNEGHLAGLSELIKATSADGVVLDTRGESSKELQAAADAVRKGVVMYSEGMAVPKNMNGIVSGRVHNALYYPPMLNLNKLIKPEFAIFRVAELYKEPIRREFVLALFNGYGIEINQFAPGHPEWQNEQYSYLGKTARILRENALNFTSRNYTPLIETTRDSIWVNKWESGKKTLYTIYSLIPEGYRGLLIEGASDEQFHFVDLWHHEQVRPVLQNGGTWLPITVDAFNARDLGTNNEGEVSCLARLPKLLTAQIDGDQLSVSTKQKGEIKIWAGDPSYTKKPFLLNELSSSIYLSDVFGRFEGKFVIQLFDDGILQDETILSVAPGTARLISRQQFTKQISKAPDGMVKIPKGKFVFKATNGDEFIPYPKQNLGRTFDLPAFYMDKFPVTNAQFKKFLDATKYTPADTSNFLKHWQANEIPHGQENYPVVYVSWEDARAFAEWSGKRLPTEVEWQYAAQTSALNEWPWKQKAPVTRKEEVVTETLTVTSIVGIDPNHANQGDGKVYPVGKYPKGANPNGLLDLSGCVWQMTNDLYQSGSYRYIILKGGSYFKPSSSWWYVQGGPRELHYRQFLLRVSAGFERNATVGFRCVADAE